MSRIEITAAISGALAAVALSAPAWAAPGGDDATPAVSQPHQRGAKNKGCMAQGKHRAAPAVFSGTRLPTVERALPRLRTHLPRLRTQLPRLANELPSLANELPRLAQGLPRLRRELPRLRRGLPRLRHELPGLAAPPRPLQQRLPRLTATFAAR